MWAVCALLPELPARQRLFASTTAVSSSRFLVPMHLLDLLLGGWMQKGDVHKCGVALAPEMAVRGMDGWV